MAAALLLFAALAAPAAQGTNRDVWLAAVAQHEPGTWDTAAVAVSAWSTGQLDGILRSLPRRGDRPANMSEILVRAAMLHADIAMHAPGDYTRPLTPHTGAPSRGVLLDEDGRYAGARMESPDWAFARRLLDALEPGPATHDVVRVWYRATLAWMAREGQVAEAVAHLERASALFPTDPDMHFARGWLNETFAAPSTQAMIASLRNAQRPSVRGTSRQIAAVPPPGEALERAERAFAAAVAADERFTEARTHRARVAHLRGGITEAVADLRRALEEAEEPFLIYMTALFLGGALEVSGDNAGAEEAYRRAAAPFPLAQSARLGLSRVASRRGDRAAALRHVRTVMAIPSNDPRRDDPWWIYQVGPGRFADARLAELHAAVAR